MGGELEIAGFRVEAELGRGGMGVVYVAIQQYPERRVALKVLSPELAADPEFRERFVRESNAAAATEHPNIVPVYAAGEDRGQLYIAMRLVEGEDLSTLIQREGPLEPSRAVELMGQVAEGLDAAHARGLVHRDVKPANVLIESTASGREHAYLTDFGLVRRISASAAVTKTGMFMGTLDYAAPEQIQGAEPDARSDVYALACLLFECLTGEAPFRRPTDAATLYAHLQDPPPRPSAARRGIPVHLDEVVVRGMAKDPDDRFASAGDLARASRGALVERNATVPALPIRPPKRRAPILIGVAVAGLVAIVVAIAVLATRGGENEPAADPSGQQLTSPTGAAGSSVAGSTGTVDAPPLNSAARVDPDTGAVEATIPGLAAPLGSDSRTQLEVSGGSVWVLNGGTISEIDAEAGQVVDGFPTAGLGQTASGAAEVFEVNFRTIWHDGRRAILRLDPASGESLPAVDLPLNDFAFDFATGEGAVWATIDDGRIARITPQTGDIAGFVDVGGSPTAIAAGAGKIWVADKLAGTLIPVDPDDEATESPIEVPGNVDDLVAGEGAAWVLDATAGTVTRIDAMTGAVGEPVRIGPDPTDLDVGLGAVWVSDEDGSLYRIDAVTGQVSTFRVGAPMSDVAIDPEARRVWVAVSKTPSEIG